MKQRVGSSELIVRQRLRVLSRMLPAAREGDVGAIHHARVATRRLREALPLVAAGPKGLKLERVVRKLTRGLGLVRELDVALLTLDEFAPSREVPRAAVTRLQQTVRAERRRLITDMVRTIDACDLEKLRKRAVAAARKFDDDEPRRTRGPMQVAAVQMRSARRAERLRAAIDNAAGIYLPDRLHDVRIAVKKLRYSMEIVRELTGSRATARIAALKRSQDLLGRMHDLEVLIARTRAVQGSPQAPSLQLSADLDRLVRHLETECRRLHGHYIAARPALLAISDHVVDAADRPRRRASAA